MLFRDLFSELLEIILRASRSGKPVRIIDASCLVDMARSFVEGLGYRLREGVVVDLTLRSFSFEAGVLFKGLGLGLD